MKKEQTDMAVVSHYDSLIEENNDPVYDPEPLRKYMDKWDGDAFINELGVSPEKDVLEIGVGTGRLALRVCSQCKSFTGIDISPKTIKRAKENFLGFFRDLPESNAAFICADFMTHEFDKQFDVIYSSLTFMHIKDKKNAVNKAAKLLKQNGRFVLSVSKSQDTILNYGSRTIDLFPDDAELTADYIKSSGLYIEKRFETEFAVIFAAVRGMNKL